MPEKRNAPRKLQVSSTYGRIGKPQAAATTRALDKLCGFTENSDPSIPDPMVEDPKTYAPHVRDQHLIDQAERAAVSGDTLDEARLDAIADGNAGPILLRTLHSAWVAAGAKSPAPSRLEYHRKRLQDVDAKIVEQTAKLARLRETRHEWTVSAVRALGMKTAIELNGRTCIATSRGGLLFYRPQGGPQSQSLNRRKGV